MRPVFEEILHKCIVRLAVRAWIATVTGSAQCEMHYGCKESWYTWGVLQICGRVIGLNCKT